MNIFYKQSKFFITLILLSVASLCGAQIKVDYNALPDYDYVPPVKQELGIAGGNRINTVGAVKSKGYANPSATPEELPDHWNNALTKHFPPYFYQAGPSCMCSSFTGYIFTHELNSLRNLEGENPENQMAVFFGWLQTYMNSSKEEIERDNGCPNAVDYDGRTNSNTIGYYTWRATNSGWMQGYDKWHRAMFNRAEGFYTFPQTLAKEEGRQATKRWLYNHNGDTDFYSGGLCYVTLAMTGITTERVADTPSNREAGAVNKYYIRKWGTEINHAMTLIGWDDRLEFDFDGDGIYGEAEADEKGAWIIANSWGTGWSNGGWSYVPYRFAGPVGSVGGNYFWQPYVTYARKNVFPNRTIKLLMDYSHRNELRLSVGVNPDTSATKPLVSVDMTSFKNAGNGSEEGGYPEVPMLGMYVDGLHYEPMEFGYDLTDLSSAYDPGKPLKYFFTTKISNGAGNGHIYKASIIDYRYETENGIEIPFDIDTVFIGKDADCYNVTISVVVPGEAINPPLNATLQGMVLKWDKPCNTSMKLQEYYIYKNNVLVDSVSANTTTYNVEGDAGQTTSYCVSSVYGYKSRLIESAKSNPVGNSSSLPGGDNKTLKIEEGSLVIPNAITSKLNSGTIEFWINPVNIGQNNYYICGSNKSNFFFEVTPSGQAVAGWNDNDKIATSAKSVKANTWQHIAIVVNENVMTLYVNAMKKGSITSIGSSGIPALQDIVIGTADKPFSAEIDEFRVWRKARTQAELYSSKDFPVANPASQSDLLVYLPMNLINVNGEERVEEFICGNHGIFAQGNIASVVNTNVVKGSTFKITPSIVIADSVYVNRPTLFAGIGSVNITDWKWETPGATKQNYNSQSPYITYSKPGTYTVALVTTDKDGEQLRAEKEVSVIEGVLPTPDFEMSAERVAVATPCSFVNRTTGVNCSYRWSIGSREDVYLTNVNTIFDSPGVYDITLYATNSAGTASVTKSVEVYEARPSSKLNVAPANIILGETTYLEDKSKGNPTGWMWTLTNGKRYLQVNGQFSSLVPPAPGYYDVTLQTFNNAGSDMATKNRALCVSNADAKNGLVFAGNDESLEIPRPFAADQESFTIEWWMNPSVYAGAGAFTFGDLSTNCTDKGYYTITYKTKYLNYYLPVTNQWHHYALVFDKGKISIYRDAELKTTLNATSVYTKPTWPEVFNFGRSDSPFNGYIDELRMWSEAFDASKFQAVCNKPIDNAVSHDNLCVYYDFNQNGGDVIDRSGNGYDAKRVNFGPDGDAWIVSPGVFTLDFGNDIVMTDVSDSYLTNYKAPFLSDGTPVTTSRKGAKQLLTETDNSTWVFDSPRQVDDNTISTVFVDSLMDNTLCATTRYDLGTIYNKRLYQTVTLPQGHYIFKLNKGATFSPQNSRLVVCYGDTIVNNQTIDDALASCLLSDKSQLEFDVIDDNTNISLGMILNLSSDNSYTMYVKSFALYNVTSSTQIADGVGDAYDALDKGLIGTFSGEVGALRIVSNETISVAVYNVGGQCVFNEYVSGNKRIPLAPGVYFANGHKVVVK